MSWQDGGGATSYDVHVGTSDPPPFRGTQPGTTYDPPGDLRHDTLYYWRIDARNASGVTTGDVWTFRTVGASLGVTINLLMPDEFTVDFRAFDGILHKPSETVTVSALVSGGAAKYRWYLDARPVVGATASTYVLDASSLELGTYNLSVVATKQGVPYSGSMIFHVQE